MIFFRLAWREMRHRPGYALLYVLAVTIGGAVTGGLGGYSAAVEKAVRDQAKELWAADVTVEGTSPVLDRLEASAAARWPGVRATRSVETISMARAPKTEEVAQVSLSAVAAGYPLYGAVTMEDGRSLDDVLAPGRVAAAGKLLDLLGLKPGDEIMAGTMRFRVAGVLSRRTDVPTSFFELAPALFMTIDDLKASGLLSPGGRSRDTLYLNLPADVDAEQAMASLKEDAGEEPVRASSWRTDNPGVSRFLTRTLLFLNFLGMLLLALGGVGVSAALSAALAAARPETGAMLALGAPRSWPIRLWAAWAGMLTAAGLAGAAVLGVWGGHGLSVLFKDFLPGAANVFAFSWAAAGKSAAATLVCAAAFAAFPLLSLSETPPNAVLSFGGEEAARRRMLPRLAAGAAALAGFAWIAWMQAGSPVRAGIYLASGIGIVASAAGLARLGRAGAAALLARSSRVSVRLAGRGLTRPGAMNTGVVAALSLSIGLGLALVLLEGNLRRGFADASPENGPTAFFINLRPGDVPQAEALIGREVRFFPLVRGRVISVNGVPARDLQEKSRRRRGTGGGGLTREFGFSFGEELLPTDAVSSGGALWDPAIEGPQVSVFDEFRGRFGIKPGDEVAVSVLGRRITAKVSSLRDINQSLRQPFFYFYFKPGSLGDVPHTLMGGAPMTKEDILAAEKKLARALPHVTVIDLADVADLSARVIQRLTRAVTALGAVGAAGGFLLLGASLGVTLLDRTRESVLFRTLGATVGAVAGAYALEFLWIGIGAALIGGIVGTGSAWALTVWGLELSFHAPWGMTVASLALAALGVTGVSMAVVSRSLRASPMEALRHE